MHIDEVIRRAKNATTAALGSAGIAMLNMYRTAQEMEYVASSAKILRMSGLFGVAAGIVWFFMPKASSSVEETIEETKAVMKEPLAVLLNRTIQEQKDFVADVKAKRYRPSSSTSNGWTKPYSQTSASTSANAMYGSAPTKEKEPENKWKNYVSSYQRGFDKAGKTPVQDMDDDDDDIPGYDDDDELEDSIFQEELEDYLSRLEDS